MNGLDAGTLALVATIYLAGGFVKGALGFGLPLVTISVLPFFLPVELALALNSMVLLVMNAVQVYRAGETREAFRVAAPLLAGTVVATPVGVWLATMMPATVLLGLLGCFVIGFSLMGLVAFTPKLPGSRGAGVIAGCIGGVVGAFSSAPGPVFVTYLVGLGMPRRRFMATIGLVMSLVGGLLAIGFVASGVLGPARLGLGALLLVPATLGFVAGDNFAGRLPDRVFRRLLLGVLVILGIALVRRAVAAGG